MRPLKPIEPPNSFKKYIKCLIEKWPKPDSIPSDELVSIGIKDLEKIMWIVALNSDEVKDHFEEYFIYALKSNPK